MTPNGTDENTRRTRIVMVTRIHEELVDDLDGTNTDVETVPFSYGGTSYEIDLSKRNRDDLELLLRDYVRHARVVGAKHPGATPSTSDVDDTTIRQWCLANDVEVGERGRVSRSARAAYAAAH